MERKFQFYERHGVEEYYIYDPDRGDLVGWRRAGTILEEIPKMAGFESPLLRIRFEPGEGADNLKIIGPDGEPFLTYTELVKQRNVERQRAEDHLREPVPTAWPPAARAGNRARLRPIPDREHRATCLHPYHSRAAGPDSGMAVRSRLPRQASRNPPKKGHFVQGLARSTPRRRRFQCSLTADSYKTAPNSLTTQFA